MAPRKPGSPARPATLGTALTGAVPTSLVEPARAWLAGRVRARITGDAAARHRDAGGTGGAPLFAPGRPIRTVHADAAMFVGGVRALLLQSLHPLAMAAVAEHSDYRRDPWGRLQRTAAFLGVTTFGTAREADRAIATVRAVHRRVQGTAPDGRSYAASDPHLLSWVHACEVDSFLRAHQRYGRARLDDRAADGYVADTARVARRIGVVDPPESVAALDAVLREMRAEVEATPTARAAARFLLLTPPLPVAARPAYGVLAAAAVGLLPLWARRALRLPVLPLSERLLVRPVATALTGVLRWSLDAPPPSPDPGTDAPRHAVAPQGARGAILTP